MRSFCVRVKKPTAGWVRFPEQPAEQKVDRLQLLREAPEFLGMDETNRPPPRVAFVLPPSTSNRVLVAIDEAGGLRLAGVPDHDAAGGLAAMVSELLAGSGRLWHMKLEQAQALFDAALGRSLEATVAARVGSSWSAQKFRRGLSESLEKGKFPVVLVAERHDDATREIVDYLRNMNLPVTLMVCELFQADGIEIIRPRVLVAPEPSATGTAEEATPVSPPPGPAVRSVIPPGPSFTPTVSARPARATTTPKDYPPFPTEGTTPKQQDVLARLVQLDDLGLVRRGFEFFTPTAASRSEAEGAIVIAVESARWPFPREDEVLVVVRTTRDYISGYLGMKQVDVEDFLSSLPREHKKERKGALVLRASNVYEANQLVNEMRALREVSQLGVR
uniref:Uncharacterized protein n=1 Tax=candidate division WOR-3 bacterium TaxID=2052148 RepID=A0A7C4CAR8_UNCW3